MIRDKRKELKSMDQRFGHDQSISEVGFLKEECCKDEGWQSKSGTHGIEFVEGLQLVDHISHLINSFQWFAFANK